MGSIDEPLHPIDVRLPLQYLEGHIWFEPHLCILRRGRRVQPSGFDGGLSVRLCREPLQQSNCNPILHAMRIDRRNEPSRLQRGLGLCLRQRLYSRSGFDPTVCLAGELGESGCGGG